MHSQTSISQAQPKKVAVASPLVMLCCMGVVRRQLSTHHPRHERQPDSNQPASNQLRTGQMPGV